MITTFDDLIGYLRGFHRSLSDAPGLETIPDNLPDGLARLYREFGTLIEQPAGPFSAQDCLIPSSKLELEEGMLSFLWENQGNWSCRCKPGPGDPPVLSDVADLYSDEDEGFVVISDSLNQFLTTFCLQEAVMSSKYQYEVPGTVSTEALLALGFRALWIDGQYVDDEPSHDFYEMPGEEILMLRHRSEGTFIGSPSATNLDVRFASVQAKKAYCPGQ